jgi:hypothetical protein
MLTPQPGYVFVAAFSAAISTMVLHGGLTNAGEFDPRAKSPWSIEFDPATIVQARSSYVGGGPIAIGPGPVAGTNINTLLGANTFYNQGYTGTNAVIANIEAGHIWGTHETMTHVQQIPNHPQSINEIDLHATAVGMMLAGRRGGTNPGPYQEGLAPDAQLYSGAIAAQFNGERYAGSFSLYYSSLFDQFRKAFNLGVNTTGRRADVINSSWGYDDPGAVGPIVVGLDGFANANRQTLFVAAAGNSGPAPNTVGSPGAGYNLLSVGALGPDPTYDTPTSFTSSGPNDYSDPLNGTINGVRQVVHIAAPGEWLTTAWYGGETGGNGTTDNPNVNGPGPTGPPVTPVGGPDYYGQGGWAGTSFAAPTVAGGAALLYDASYTLFASNNDARDARVMKSVLMNSARKTVGWDNGQIAHPNGRGGVFTTQGLDNLVGTGRMDLHAAFDQFLSGTTDVPDTLSGDLGNVHDLGWDFGIVNSQATNDYYFDAPLLGGSTLTATVNWFRDRRYVANNAVFDDSFDDLNLELWSVVDGMPAELISESSSRYNGSEHFSFDLPGSGNYALRVRWFGELFDRFSDPNQEHYGLAWSAIYQDAADFDDDGDFDCQDIDGLVAEIVAGTHSRPFDLTGDHLVDIADRDSWLAVAGAANLASGNAYLLGDANLDGFVDGSDYNTWNAHKFSTTAAWCSGDFSADGFVDGSDFSVWNANKFQSSSSVVPEPTSLLWPLIACMCFRAKRV